MRAYKRSESIVFFKTKEEYGGLSNMASGYSLKVNGYKIYSSEALYQACRYPHLPEVQRNIIEQFSPFVSKKISAPEVSQTRADWDMVRVNVMRWCLRVKLLQNKTRFGSLLLSTQDKSIVELSRKDQFWGVIPNTYEELEGENVLGRLLMELRGVIKENGLNDFNSLSALNIPEFNLMGEPIRDLFESE